MELGSGEKIKKGHIIATHMQNILSKCSLGLYIKYMAKAFSDLPEKTQNYIPGSTMIQAHGSIFVTAQDAGKDHKQILKRQYPGKTPTY